MKDLIDEKDKFEKDKEKIQTKPDLLPCDWWKVLKCASVYEKNINHIINKSKDRLSEYYDSKLREKSSSPKNYRSLRLGERSSSLEWETP